MTLKPARTRDEVLIGFAKSCPDPTVRDVQRWSRKYSDYASDIVALAKTLAETSGDDAVVEALNQMEPPTAKTAVETAPLDEMTFEDYRQLMADVTAQLPFPKDKGLVDILYWYGNTWPCLAEFIGIDLQVIKLVEHGMLLEPIGRKFLDALSFALETDPDLIQAGIVFDRENVRNTGSYIDPDKPRAAKTYADAIDESGMSAERKSFWLEDVPFPRWTRPALPTSEPTDEERSHPQLR